MLTRSYRIAAQALVALAFAALIVMLLLPRPEVAWNAGARERLIESLRAICSRLMCTHHGDSAHKLDPRDFVAHSVDDKVEFPPRRASLLAERHGVLEKWYRDGAYEEVFFYPIAISPEIVIEPHSNVEPAPQIVMVPVGKLDRKTLPNLYGCGNTAAEETRECQLRRMKELFIAHGMDYAATLMSDGSVVYVRVDDLCNTSR